MVRPPRGGLSPPLLRPGRGRANRTVGPRTGRHQQGRWTQPVTPL